MHLTRSSKILSVSEISEVSEISQVSEVSEISEISEVSDISQESEMSAISQLPVISANQVTVMAEDRPVLSKLNLQIQQGEWVAIIGKSGSGKSTLAKVLAGVAPVQQGEIQCTIKERPSIQLIMQNPESQMVGETVYEDICFGLENYAVPPSEITKRAQAAMVKVGLEHQSEYLTEWLSGGQKQLLAIAGAIALNAPVLIFDEATSMLDPSAKERILNLARESHDEGKTILWITQLMDELAWADRIIVLEQGAIVFDGSRETFFYHCPNDTTAYCAYFGFDPPFAVQVAHQLREQGLLLTSCPVSPEQLAEAVGDRLCR